MPSAARVGAVRIARDVARLIERGEYRPGQRLREQELADRFATSRAPVREALRILESQGLVVVEEMRGARVVEVDEDAFLEVVMIRAALAGVVGQRAAEGADPAARAALVGQARAVLSLAEGGGDLASVYAGLRGLARALGELSPSPRAQAMLGGLTAGREAFQSIGLSTHARRVQSARQWVRAAEAIAAGDGPGARAALHGLYDRSIRFILAAAGRR